MNAKERKSAHDEFARRLACALGVEVLAKRKSHKNWLTISLEPWSKMNQTISDDDLNTFRKKTDFEKARMIIDGVQALKSNRTKLEESTDRV